MSENNYEKKVLEILKDTDEKSTSEIASIISRDFYFAQRLLEDLKGKNLIEKIEVGNFTYWKIKENGKEI